MSIFKAAIVHFGLVFTAGFALGTVRTIWLVPLVGERSAELLETPVMIIISFLAARWVVGKMKEPSFPKRLQVGALALLFLLGCEAGVVVFVLQQSLGEYITGREPVAGMVYVVALAVFAAAPSVIGRTAVLRQSDES